MSERLPVPSTEVAPISYITRSGAYYTSLGYEEPYRWAHHTEAPFASLARPLSECRIGIVTSAAPYRPEFGDQGPHAPYNAEAKFRHVYTLPSDAPPDLRISHIGYDRAHTTAEDQDSYFPLKRLREAEAAGRIGSIAARFYGIETTRSQRQTNERDAPEVLRLMREDGVDAAILVAT